MGINQSKMGLKKPAQSSCDVGQFPVVIPSQAHHLVCGLGGKVSSLDIVCIPLIKDPFPKEAEKWKGDQLDNPWKAFLPRRA